METLQQEVAIRRYFLWSVWIKGLISLGEMVAGIVVYFVPPAFLVGWIISAAQNDLINEPGDFISSHALSLASDFAVSSALIIAVYLFSRGLIKLLLVWALLKNQLWAYHASLVVLGLFILYQIYEIFIGHSALMVLITVFDLIVVYFIWREWRIIREHGGVIPFTKV